MFCEWVFEAAKYLQISNFITSKIKTKQKNNLLLDPMEQNTMTSLIIYKPQSGKFERDFALKSPKLEKNGSNLAH